MNASFEITAILPNTYLQEVDYTLYLFNRSSMILLPISISQWECKCLLEAKSKKRNVRPPTCSTLRRVIVALGGKPTCIHIYKYLAGVCYTYVCIQCASGLIEVDANLADAMSLAIIARIPVYADAGVCESAGIHVTRELLKRSLEV